MSFKFLLVLFSVFSVSLNGFSQVAGCTDPQGLNYNPEATINDGSCVYPSTSISPAVIVNSLPQPISETSGLIYWNGGLWTQNDSGNPAELYKIDTITGQILQTITITGADNVDWEDLAQDENHIYIGDFGNNLGNRTDLKIYITDKSSYPLTGDGSVSADIINFSYGDQLKFKKKNRSNDFDCESLMAFGDSLYIFTKNWANEQTRLYAMPKNPGTYEILPNDQFNVDGLITGADILEDGSEVVLCGYKNYSPFIWLLFDFEGSGFFNGNKRRINFAGMLGTQTEGVSYTFSRNVYVSAEKTSIAPARLFRFNTSAWTVVLPTGVSDTIPDKQGMLLIPNPNNGSFRLKLGYFCEPGDYMADVINSQGVSVVSNYPLDFSGCSAEVDLPNLNSGFYLLRFHNAKEVYTGRLLISQR